MDARELARQFTQFYYSTFDADRFRLASLYRDTSMLTFEEAEFKGTAEIIQKLTTLPFQKVQHKVTTIDAQPSRFEGAVIVNVTGQLLVDNETNPLNFSQIFQLAPDAGSYYVHNDIFRLNYG